MKSATKKKIIAGAGLAIIAGSTGTVVVLVPALAFHSVFMGLCGVACMTPLIDQAFFRREKPPGPGPQGPGNPPGPTP